MRSMGLAIKGFLGCRDSAVLFLFFPALSFFVLLLCLHCFGVSLHGGEEGDMHVLSNAERMRCTKHVHTD